MCSVLYLVTECRNSCLRAVSTDKLDFPTSIENEVLTQFDSLFMFYYLRVMPRDVDVYLWNDAVLYKWEETSLLF